MSEILENRRKWIAFLKQPDTKKAQGYLVDYQDTEARCCLGHACHVLGAEYDDENRFYDDEYYYAPQSIVDKLGLWTKAGSAPTGALRGMKYSSLSNWNDGSPVTPQEIGAYLETVIMGGDDTPFRRISA